MVMLGLVFLLLPRMEFKYPKMHLCQYGAWRPVVCEELKVHKEHIGQHLGLE